MSSEDGVATAPVEGRQAHGLRYALQACAAGASATVTLRIAWIQSPIRGPFDGA